MKYAILILSLISLGLHTQPYTPSVSHMTFDASGFGFGFKAQRTESNRTTEETVFRYLNYTVRVDSQVATIKGDTLLFESLIKEKGTINRNTTTKASLAIDTKNRIFRFLSVYVESYTENAQHPYYNETARSTLTFQNVPYLEQGDTAIFSLDSAAIAAALIKSHFDSSAHTRFSYTSSAGGSKLYLNPLMSFSGIIIGLQHYFSAITPNRYVIDQLPDTIKKQYADSFTFTYYNESPDTVKIKSIRFEDTFAQLMTVTYADGSPLTTERTIPPFTKAPFQIHIVTQEGPHTQSHYTNFIVSKEIAEAPHEETFRVLRHMTGIDYSNRIQFSDLNLYFSGKPGDTIDRSITMTYQSPIVRITMDTLPAARGFILIGTDSTPGTTVYHIRYIATTAGRSDHLGTIRFAYTNFAGVPEVSHQTRQTLLSATITEPSKVNQLDALNIFFYDPSQRLLIITLPDFAAATLMIHDVSGKVVQRKSFTSAQQRSSIQLRHDLPSGIYFVTLQSDAKIHKYKLVII